MKKTLFKKNKTISATIFALFCFFVKTPIGKAAETLINYPEINGTDLTWGTSLPDIIKYVYLFSVGICGAVALLSILIGAIKYVGAAGNPSKMSDAKEQIFSAILGVIILLSSYLILNTINPDLVNFNLNLSR